MKRIAILLLAALLLSACLPTPDAEYIVYRGGDELEQKLHDSPVPVEINLVPPEGAARAEAIPAPNAQPTEPIAAQTFPERWSDALTVSDTLSIRFDAEIVTRGGGVYPVFRTRAADMDRETAVSILERALPKPVSLTSNAMTKADYTEQFKAFLAEVEEEQAWIDAGRPDWGDRDDSVLSQSEIEERSRWYQEQILAAPNSNESRAASDYRGVSLNGEFVYTLADGRNVFIELYPNRFTFGLGCKGAPNVIDADDYRVALDDGDEWTGSWRETTLDEQDARAMLAAFTERLGLDDFAVCAAKPANLMEMNAGRTGIGRQLAAGWFFKLKRAYGGYPLIDYFNPAQDFEYAGDDYVVNKPIKDEYLTAFVAEDGVRAFTWSHRKEVVGVENGSVALEPFDAIQTRVKNAMAAGLRPWKNDRPTEYRVYRMLLSVYTLRVRDSDEYYEMPCWFVFYDDGVDPGLKSARGLIVNAVDGSLVHPDNAPRAVPNR